jgi:hypothetical protein
MRVIYKVLKERGTTKLVFGIDLSREESNLINEYYYDDPNLQQVFESCSLGRNIIERLKKRYHTTKTEDVLWKLRNLIIGDKLPIPMKELDEGRVKELADNIRQYFENLLIEAINSPAINREVFRIEIPEDVKARIREKFLKRFGHEPDLSITVKVEKQEGMHSLVFKSIIQEQGVLQVLGQTIYTDAEINFINEKNDHKHYYVDLLNPEWDSLEFVSFKRIKDAKSIDDIISILSSRLRDAIKPKFDELISIIETETEYETPLNVEKEITDLFPNQVLAKYPHLSNLKVKYHLERENVFSLPELRIEFQYPKLSDIATSREASAEVKITKYKSFIINFRWYDCIDKNNNKCSIIGHFKDDKPMIKRKGYYTFDEAIKLLQKKEILSHLTKYEDEIITKGVMSNVKDAIISILIELNIIPDVYSEGLMEQPQPVVIKEDYKFLKSLERAKRTEKTTRKRIPVKEGVVISGSVEMSEETLKMVAPALVAQKLKNGVTEQ